MKAGVSRIALLAVVAAGCATTHYLATNDIENQMIEQLQKVDENAAQVEGDFAQNSDTSKDIESVRKLKKTLHEDHDAFKAKVGSRNKVKGAENDFTDVEDLVHQFDDHLRAFNQSYSGYIAAAKTINQKKLKVTADVNEIRSTFRKTSSHATENLAAFDSQIAGMKILAEQNGKPLSEAARRKLSDDRDAYKNSLHQLEDDEKFFRSDLKGVRQITSADARWPEFEKRVTDAEAASRDMKEISVRLKKELEEAGVKGTVNDK